MKCVFKILAVGLGILIFLGLDFASRQLYIKIYRKVAPSAPLLRVPDTAFHHGLRKNCTAKDEFGPFSVEYSSNSLGFRDAKIREVPLKKEGLRILFIGDSFTEGVGIPWEFTFVGKIYATLTPHGVDVLNAGVVSYCPTLVKAKLHYYLVDLGLEVDMVVLLIDISDVADEFYYEERNDRTIQSIPHGPFVEQAGKMKNMVETCDWLKKHIETNFSVLGAVSRNLRMQYQRRMELAMAIPEIRCDWPDYRGPRQSFVEQGLFKAKARMTEIAQMLRTKGISLKVVIYPWPEQIQARSRPSRAEKEWTLWAHENQVQLINLFPLFVNDTSPEENVEKYYLPQDVHWNERGHDRVAQEILRHGGLLDAGQPMKP